MYENRLGWEYYQIATEIGDEPGELAASKRSVVIPGEVPATNITCGRQHCCTLLEDRRVMCWGRAPFPRHCRNQAREEEVIMLLRLLNPAR